MACALNKESELACPADCIALHLSIPHAQAAFSSKGITWNSQAEAQMLGCAVCRKTLQGITLLWTLL